MDVTKLVSKLKAMGTISTLVGDFSFIKQIGEGGNSNVCLYTKNGLDFAVKFFQKARSLSQRPTGLLMSISGWPKYPHIRPSQNTFTLTR